MMFRKTLKENNTTSKQFDYSQGDVSLKFTLRTDIKSQLKDFKLLLEKALSDVISELERETL